MIRLREYGGLDIPAGMLPRDAARELIDRYSGYLDLGARNPLFPDQLTLTAKGWVGYYPLPEGMAIIVEPRTRIANLFRMLEETLDLATFRLFDGMMNCQSVRDLFERLALMLADRVRERCRRGLYRSYLARQERLSCVRGRLLFHRMRSATVEPSIPCAFEEQTADIDDNRILTWTLDRVGRSGICRPEVMEPLRVAYRTLLGQVELRPFRAEECVGRTYHRLNDDYRGMHAICRLLLMWMGPHIYAGDASMIPFAVDMGRLFETFVARWMSNHADPRFEIVAQAPHVMSNEPRIEFRMDMVIREREIGRPLMVLDTKYKIKDAATGSDLEQIIAYAHMKGCREAVLLYPVKIGKPVDAWVNGIRVRTLAFPLDGDLEEAGMRLLQVLGLASEGVEGAMDLEKGSPIATPLQSVA